jgi:hypothetical protein
LQTEPWNDRKPHNHTLGLHKTPWTKLGPRNVVPGPRGRRGWPKSGELLAGEGRGSGRGGSRSRKESIYVRTRDGERAGGWARRTSAAAGGLALESRWPGLDWKRVWEALLRRADGLAWTASDVRGRRPCTAVRLLVGRRGVDALRADLQSRAVAWRFRERRMDRRTKDRPRCADPADRGAATATPARALWSARVPTQLSLALFRRVFLKFLN